MRFTDDYMLTDCGEAGVHLWSLEYHFKKILTEAEGIAQETMYKRPLPYLSPPGWILAHMAVKERDHIAGFAQGANDVPRAYGVFRGNPQGKLPSEKKMLDAFPDIASIIAYYQNVRDKTKEYLETLSDEDFKIAPSHRKNDDPLREFFVMTIHHQNYHWAQLRFAQKALEAQ